MEQCMERPKQKQKKKKREKPPTIQEEPVCSVETENSVAETSVDIPEVAQEVKDAPESPKQDEIEQTIEPNAAVEIETPPDEATKPDAPLNPTNILEETIVKSQSESLSFDKIMTRNKQIVRRVEQTNKFYDAPESPKVVEIEEATKPKVVLGIQTPPDEATKPDASLKSTSILRETITKNQLESSSFDTIMAKNKQIIKTVEQINKFYDEYQSKQVLLNEPPLIKCTNEVKFRIESIRPYTEAQLLALYSNSEMETLQQFLFAFVDYELKGAHIRQHPLYDLLEQYLQNKNKITANNLEIEQARQEYFEIQNQLWSVQSTVVKEQGTCLDENIVYATHTYNKATFHRSSFQAMNSVLGKIRHLSNECQVLYSYSASINKMQIELFIHNLCTYCINATRITQHCAVALNLKDYTPEVLAQLQELKTCISILFLFQRRLIRDVEFVKETRAWLQDLVAILLRVANYQDHLFILSHVLRCPPGISTWASAFVQTPLPKMNDDDSPFSSFEINHIVTILSLLLLPIDKREQFLEELMQHKDNPGESAWVMVDSDGEEDDESSGLSLRENDLVSLFNQLPIDDVFRVLLKIQQKNGEDYLDGTQITEHHILRLLAFSTMILRILQTGLQTYGQNRYNQFAKRLSRMVRHIVQYATDISDYFKNNHKINDTAMLERLQVEYDAFFLRAIYCLYNSKKIGAWQFLAVVPYNLISRRCLWKIFYFLHDPDSCVKSILDPTDNTDYSQKLWDMNIRNQFEEKLNSLEDSESYYLLNTFANMALSRGSDDMDFIEAAMHDLLHIGFISETTQDNCCKNARILLTHITSKYSSLFSYILRIVELNIDKIGSLSLYLYEELPISIWKPDDSDIMIITKLLRSNPINHDGSRLARMIISRLNWDIAGESLFIPYTFHCKIALLVAEIVQEEPAYSQWGWQTLFRLRLHYTDKGLTDFAKIFEPERFDVLRRGIKEQNLLSCFLSLLMTTYGHLIPVICSKGFDQLLLLQANQKYEAVLFVLNLIIPLFLNCQETLVNSEKFQNIVTGALNAKKGYLHLAKSLIGIQNLVMQQFGYLIENQILNYRYYGVESARYVVRIWINTLVSVPNWNKDFNVMYLLDVIVGSSYLNDDALSCCVTIIKDLLQIVSPQDQNSTISSLFKWATPSQALLINSSLGSYPWLAYLIIDLEFEERERQTGLWREILSQLENQKGKINVDAAIKKAASVLKLPSFSSGSLCLFRWARQALDTKIDHPLLPLMWQKFFSLFLYRLPVSGCIGEKFFEGVINFQFQKRLKRHLAECVSHYQKQYDEATAENFNQKMFFEATLGIMKAYSLWLEEPTLQESTLYLPSLPPEYKPNYLSLIFQGNTSPWMEFVNTFAIHDEQQKGLKSWRLANYREKSNVNQPLPQPGNRNEPDDPCERIILRLKTYDVPKGPPPLNIPTPVLLAFNLNDKEEMFKSLDAVFKTVSRFAREHSLSCSEYKTLDCMYQELVPQLYMSVINKITKQVTCNQQNRSSDCSGAAVITLTAKEARVNEGIRHQIDNNRRNYDTLLKKFMLPPSQYVCQSAVTLLQAISNLRGKLSADGSTLEMGVELFYYILSLLNEEINNYLPGKQLYSQCLKLLGQSHIHGREFEHPRLLNNILEKPELRVYLLPHFVPVNSGTANFILMYTTICEKILDKYDVAFALLSKFDVHFWLKTKNPKLAQRSKFINVLVQTLQTLGFEPHPDSSDLHALLRKHLILMLDHQFPEHFGEILIILLKASNCGMDSGYIAVSVWIDFLNYLSKPIEINIALPLRDQIRLYAQKQRLLRHNELLETASLLSKHFTQERFQYGLYGLYPKTRNYVEVFMAFNGMIGHALVISTLNMHPGVLGDSLCEKIWPYLRDMFSPWVMPYWMQNMKDNMANWIKQLTDDRAVVLPWIPSDGPFALKSVQMFFECVMFVVQTLPASGKILSFVWHWYVTNYAHTSVKDHVLNVLHSSFIALPWQNFWPSIADLELMLKVVEQYLPDCHVFLGHIFMSVNWPVWLTNLVDVTPIQVKAKVLHSILILLVKLSNEPKVRANHVDKAKALLVQGECFDWSLIDHEMYHHIVDWYVMSCDSSVIFKLDPLDLDFRILSFLSAVAHYTKTTQLTNDSFQKRHIYIRSYVKLVAVYASRHKNVISTKEKDLQHLIINQLNYLERYRNQQELNVLFATFLEILNISSISSVSQRTFEEYIANKSKDATLMNAVLNGLGNTVCDIQVAASVYEVTLLNYFAREVIQNKVMTWKNVISVVTFSASKQADLENILVKKGCVLTLHAYMMQKIERALDYKHLISTCLDWMRNVKITEEIESKIPLLWVDVLTMALDYCEIDEPCCGMLLHKFSQTLINCAEENEGSKWGRSILGAIGIIKPTISIQFKFLCKAIAAYVLAQLPETKGNPQTIRRIVNAPGKVGQPGGNTDCPKVLLKLDFGYTQGKIKDCAEIALKEIQNPTNSLHNVLSFLNMLLNQFYIKSYLRDIG